MNTNTNNTTTTTTTDTTTTTHKRNTRLTVNPLEAAVWTLHSVYNTDKTPDDTAAALIQREGHDTAAVLLASLVNLYAWDGRISGRAKKWAATVPAALDENTARKYGVYTTIHRAHLDQIVNAFIDLDRRAAETPAKAAAIYTGDDTPATATPAQQLDPTATEQAATTATVDTPTASTFDDLKRDFERAAAAYTPADRETVRMYEHHHAAALAAHREGKDYTTDRAAALRLRPAYKEAKDRAAALAAAALALAGAVAASVVNKLYDPQRKTAAALFASGEAYTYTDNKGHEHKANTSHSGQAATMLALRRGIQHDTHLLTDTAAALNAATRATFNKDGDPVTVPADKDAAAAVGDLIGETLTDGIDLVQTAAAALLEQAEQHSGEGPGWLDTVYTVQKLKKSVLSPGQTPEYIDRETTPIQEAYRAVRRAVQTSRAVQTDPKSGYIYIADLGGEDDGDALERVYYRGGRFADLGGYAVSGEADTLPGSPAGFGKGSGLASGDIETLEHMEKIAAALNMTAREKAILRRRLAGASLDAIAAALHVRSDNVRLTLRRLQNKWLAAGLPAPRDWTEESRAAAVDAPHPVEQIDPSGAVVGRYDSAKSAAKFTGINAGNIRAAAAGKRPAAGGFGWRFVAAPVAAPVAV